VGHRHRLEHGRGLDGSAAECALGRSRGGDFDQDGLCAQVRAVVHDNLPTGWTLDENQFIKPTPIPEDALNIIRETVDEIDLWELAQYYDNGD
jgi:hypothetical protein